MRKTKIICTLGPATDGEGIMEELIKKGMNVARVNFSHGTHEDHKRRIDEVKRIRQEQRKKVAVLVDTRGPEIRTGMVKDSCMLLNLDDEITLTTKEVMGGNGVVSVNYKHFPEELGQGDRVMIDDGLIELEVIGKNDTDVFCRVVNGGMLGSRKGVNLPGIRVRMPYISERDKEDILFGIENDVDFVAASFVRTAKDVLEIRRLLDENGG